MPNKLLALGRFHVLGYLRKQADFPALHALRSVRRSLKAVRLGKQASCFLPRAHQRNGVEPLDDLIQRIGRQRLPGNAYERDAIGAIPKGLGGLDKRLARGIGAIRAREHHEQTRIVPRN
jgi:hypothetical protein